GWLVLAVGNDGQWRQFCQAAERPDLAADGRFTTNVQRVGARDVLVPILEELLRGRTTREWEERLLAARVPHPPLWHYADLFAHSQGGGGGLRVPVRDPGGRPVELVGTPFHIAGATLPAPTAPPGLGEHTDEVLRELLGLDAARLEELRKRGVI